MFHQKCVFSLIFNNFLCFCQHLQQLFLFFLYNLYLCVCTCDSLFSYFSLLVVKTFLFLLYWQQPWLDDSRKTFIVVLSVHIGVTLTYTLPCTICMIFFVINDCKRCNFPFSSHFYTVFPVLYTQFVWIFRSNETLTVLLLFLWKCLASIRKIIRQFVRFACTATARKTTNENR